MRDNPSESNLSASKTAQEYPASESKNELLQKLDEISKKLDKIEVVGFPRTLANGIVSGFGAVVGATILVAFVIWLLQQVDTVPLAGEYISDIIDVVQEEGGRV
jgi:hypothetical protein